MIKINEKFEPLFKQPKNVRYYIVTGGRGSGKSFGASIWANLKTFENSSRILYTRYTLNSAHISIIPEFTDKLELLNVHNSFHVTKQEILNKETGSEILFRGIKTSSGNQTANLKSLSNVATWILDEAEELVDEDTFDKIDLSIRSEEAQNIVVLILNPTIKEHWIYKRFFERRNIPDMFCGIVDDTCYIHTTYEDNIDNLSESFIKTVEQIKEDDPEKYQHVILGGWLEHLDGVLFTKFDLSYYNELNKDSVVGKLCYVDTADAGTDSHCAVIGYLVGDKLYIEDVVYTDEDTSVNVDMTADLVNRHKPEYCRIETNFGGGMYRNMLQPKITGETMLLAVNNSTNKHSRIVQMAGFIKQHVRFKENVTHGSEYYHFMHNIYQYTKDGKAPHDDGIDALVGLCTMAKSFYSHLWDVGLELD